MRYWKLYWIYLIAIAVVGLAVGQHLKQVVSEYQPHVSALERAAAYLEEGR